MQQIVKLTLVKPESTDITQVVKTVFSTFTPKAVLRRELQNVEKPNGNRNKRVRIPEDKVKSVQSDIIKKANVYICKDVVSIEQPYAIGYNMVTLQYRINSGIGRTKAEKFNALSRLNNDILSRLTNKISGQFGSFVNAQVTSYSEEQEMELQRRFEEIVDSHRTLADDDEETVTIYSIEAEETAKEVKISKDELPKEDDTKAEVTETDKEEDISKEDDTTKEEEDEPASETK